MSSLQGMFAVAVLLGGGWTAAQAQSGPGVIAETRGRLTSCVRNGNSISITLDGKPVPITLSERDDTTRRSGDYDRVVGHLYRVDGGCPTVGTQLRITRCGICALVSLISVEVDDTGGTLDVAHSSLWIIRQYFDIAPPRREDDFAVSIASMVLARYNRRDGLRRSVWVRDTIAHALDTYSSSDRATAMIQAFGRSDLTSTIPALTSIAKNKGGSVGAVRVFPYIPQNPMAAPFVGAWGTFAAEVYLEETGGRLTLAYGSARLVPSSPTPLDRTMR